MIRTKWSTAGIVAACAVANWLIGVVLMSMDIEEYSPSFEEYGPYICTGFAVGVVTIIALPFALEHQPRELSDVDYAGSTRSFIAGCIVLLGSSSYFGAASGVVAFISMVSRRSTSRSVAQWCASWWRLRLMRSSTPIWPGTISDGLVPSSLWS